MRAHIMGSYATHEQAVTEAARLSRVFATKFPESAAQIGHRYRVRRRRYQSPSRPRWFVFGPAGTIPRADQAVSVLYR